MSRNVDTADYMFFLLTLQDRKRVEIKELKKRDVIEIYKREDTKKRLGTYVVVADAYYDFSAMTWYVDTRQLT